MPVAVPALKTDDEGLELSADGRSAGQPEREAGAALLLGGEDVQLPTQASVIWKVHRVSFRTAAGRREDTMRARGHRPGRVSVLPLRLRAG